MTVEKGMTAFEYWKGSMVLITLKFAYTTSQSFVFTIVYHLFTIRDFSCQFTHLRFVFLYCCGPFLQNYLYSDGQEVCIRFGGWLMISINKTLNKSLCSANVFAIVVVYLLLHATGM